MTYTIEDLQKKNIFILLSEMYGQDIFKSIHITLHENSHSFHYIIFLSNLL